MAVQKSKRSKSKRSLTLFNNTNILINKPKKMQKILRKIVINNNIHVITK